MSAWHWMRRGCARDEVFAACATCGYGLEGMGAGGKCPECGMPFIAATIQRRGPTAAIEWIALWTFGPPALLALCVWILWQWPTAAASTIIGLVFVVVAVQHQSSLDWYVNHTLSDIDRQGAGVWTVLMVWTIISALSGIGGLALLVIGAFAAFS